MTDNGICSLLGLAKRAGKLAAGDEPVRELARSGVVRVVLLASDAGAAVSRQARFLAERAEVPLLTLPVTGAELGGALGRKTCAVCALSDSGFAAKAAEKLAAIDTAAQGAAEALAKSHARFQARRGTKKHRQREPAEPPRETASREHSPKRGSRTAKPSARRGGAPSESRERASRHNNTPERNGRTGGANRPRRSGEAGNSRTGRPRKQR